MNVQKKITDVFKVQQLQKKIFFTLLFVFIYRVGTVIPIPGIDIDAVKSIFFEKKNVFLGFFNMFSGGAFNRVSIFSLGVMPYINASIIMSLIQGAHLIPYFDKLAKEGDHGRKKISKITKFITLFIGMIHSFGFAIMLTKMSTPTGNSVVIDSSISWIMLVILTLITGTILTMWFGEQITEKGIGNGVSIIIFTGIVERLPYALINILKFINKEASSLLVLILALIVALVFILVIWVETAQRKIFIHYARRAIGRKMYNRQTSFLPIKIDQSGVIAVIFSVSILSIPFTLVQFTPNWTIWGVPLVKNVLELFSSGSIAYNFLYVSLIIFFCYFYNSISFNTKELAENIKKSSGFIYGIRPGEQTSIYIQKILKRVTLSGALFVALLAVLPDYLKSMLKSPFFFGGTTLLIVVGVSLDTINQIESYLIMYRYEDLIKDGYKIRRK
ncbi:MAG: preprotein translocase subunit SecY [Endomicrobium sp.]|jgi:preprotein translocase subunit SecY|nr:preprotein translocase subunit SecY [Endomicrobium sp.]